MGKRRVLISSDRADEVLFACDYTCCKCRVPGLAVQIHHIDENPGNNREDNLAPLCLNCHDLTQITGGFGRKLNAVAVSHYKKDWVERVAFRRDKADEIAALHMAGLYENVPTTEQEAEARDIPSGQALVDYINRLPDALAEGYALAEPRWGSGITSDMIGATYDLIDTVRQMLVHLASWYPPNHFDSKPPAEYFSKLLSSRFVWHRAVLEPEGAGTGGTLVEQMAAGDVLDDVERAVNEMVSWLMMHEDFDLKNWRRRWQRPILAAQA